MKKILFFFLFACLFNVSYASVLLVKPHDYYPWKISQPSQWWEIGANKKITLEVFVDQYVQDNSGQQHEGDAITMLCGDVQSIVLNGHSSVCKLEPGKVARISIDEFKYGSQGHFITKF